MLLDKKPNLLRGGTTTSSSTQIVDRRYAPDVPPLPSPWPAPIIPDEPQYPPIDSGLPIDDPDPIEDL